MSSHKFPHSARLLRRAECVIPGGVFGHNRFPAAFDPGDYPVFAARAQGASFDDVDGNRYVDYLCGYGAMINGYAHPDIDAAAKLVLDRGDCLNQPTEVAIELAEHLCRTIAGADFCAFAKNGSDATNLALLIARAATGRQKVVCARGAYHGSHLWCNWCNPGAGRPPEDSHMVARFEWNDANELERLLERQGHDVAAVMLTPFHHPIPGRAAMPSLGFWPAVRELTRRFGVALIVDDVRAGFRLSLAGSHAFFGFDADLVCFSKAIANTHPLAAVTGAKWLRQAAASVFVAGTFWSAAAPMAAACVNLKLLADNDAIDRMAEMGTALGRGLVALGARHGLEVEVTGPPSMPTITIVGDEEIKRMRAFARAMVRAGSFVHPAHNWFLSAAHSPADIETLLVHADEAFSKAASA